jgi:hypothetical protein
MIGHDDANFIIVVILGCGLLGVLALGIDWLLTRLGLVDADGWFSFLD